MLYTAHFLRQLLRRAAAQRTRLVPPRAARLNALLDGSASSLHPSATSPAPPRWPLTTLQFATAIHLPPAKQLHERMRAGEDILVHLLGAALRLGLQLR